jgi:hypothetical protein
VVSHNGGCAGASTGFECLFEPLSACALPQLHGPAAAGGLECTERVVSLAADTFNVLRMVNPQLDPDRGAFVDRSTLKTRSTPRMFAHLSNPTRESCALFPNTSIAPPRSMWRSQCGTA